MNGSSPKRLTDLGMRLHVPYNNDPGLIPALLPYADQIASVYLPCNHEVLGSGRYEGRAVGRNWGGYDEEVNRIAEQLAPYGIHITMLLNSIHIPSEILANFQGSALYRYLKRYEHSRVEWLAVANIQLAMLIRQHLPGFKLDVSVLGLVDSVSRARYWNDLVHPDLFCVDLDCSRNLSLIRQITEATGVPVKILALDFCLPECPYKPWHYIHNALKEESAFNCWSVRATEPWRYYRGRAVPPFYLQQYAGIVRDIKIVERNADTPTVLSYIRHYAESLSSKYLLPDGGLIPAGGRGKRMNPAWEQLYLKLNCKHPLFRELPEQVYQATAACDHSCMSCTLCYDVWKQEWQVRENYGLLKDEVTRQFSHPVDQRYYLRLLDTLHAQRHNLLFLRNIKRIRNYAAAGFYQVLDYLYLLALLEMKCLQRFEAGVDLLQNQELKEDLLRLQQNLTGTDILTYGSFDQDDTTSFYYLNQLEKRAAIDCDAWFELVEAWLLAGEEENAAAVFGVPPEQPGLKRLEELILFSFQNECYQTVVKLTEPGSDWQAADGRSRERFAVLRRFARLMIDGAAGAPSEHEQPGAFVWYGPREAFAYLYCLWHDRKMGLNRKEIDGLTGFVESLLRSEDWGLAGQVCSLCLQSEPDNLAILRRMQKVAEATCSPELASLGQRIDALYVAITPELDRIETLENKAAAHAARAELYYRIKDFDQALIQAAHLLDIDPTPRRFRAILHHSAMVTAHSEALQKYAHLFASGGEP